MPLLTAFINQKKKIIEKGNRNINYMKANGKRGPFSLTLR